ncbi:inositol polyphosphate 1-phosphatase isoform X3 [Myxocyprinus asiaticus]|uniref:inositol polyphosphate 1-phosphatase isoform X2 n=1 Tax=Myxocyprinus asiaticus TaxID=70543 RepID=UPI00222274A9|nr:inositol polyphosphate 1-phosphatase isoform X2 [Myxocyprinus asiaticus]XP_051532614.1 inositol polyphosphate 1-phosphatase isoform X3 [Myxocyprinus asiaticus]
MAELLQLLLSVSEKAADVARVCRQEAPLFELLVQEKTGADKNKKFVQDFKTLADVLIQEMIRHDVCAQFPELTGFIHGEESNKFENGHGESVTVTVCAQEDDTTTLLAKVLDGDQTAASLLSKAIHQNLQLRDELAESLQLSLCPADLAIWIDPIDGTSQYIEGKEAEEQDEGFCPSGLPCALVLIGVYLRATGQPVMGVINQPFNHKDSKGKGWKGQHVWGVSYEDVNVCSLTERRLPCQQKSGHVSVLLSSSERPAVKDALEPLSNGALMYASGAGYKILCVIQGLVDVYVLSEGSTFKWDSCAPHAVLRALGGGVLDLSECLRAHTNGSMTRGAELTYHKPHNGGQGVEKWANQGGIIAYLDSRVIDKVVAALAGKI